MIFRNKLDIQGVQTAKEMHSESLQYISELKFIADEQVFLTHLLGKYSDKPSVLEKHQELLKFRALLTENKNNCNSLLSKIQNHNNKLDVLLGDIKKPFEESEVIAEHCIISEKKDVFMHDFRELKMNVFITAIAIMKEEKI